MRMMTDHDNMHSTLLKQQPCGLPDDMYCRKWILTTTMGQCLAGMHVVKCIHMAHKLVNVMTCWQECREEFHVQKIQHHVSEAGQASR